MHVCPKGHQSQAGDYCDECGTPIAGATLGRSSSSVPSAPSPPGSAPSAGAAGGVTATPAGPPCPQCGAPPGGRFCEVCGYDFLMAKLSPPPAGTPNAQSSPGADASHPGPTAETASAAAPPNADDPDLATSTGPTSDASSSGTASGATPSGATPSGTIPSGTTPSGTTPSGTTPCGATSGTEIGNADPAAVAAGTGLAGTVPASSGWRLVVGADRDYHARMEAQAEPDSPPIPFPAYCPERRFELPSGQALIGRRSRSRGIEPEVDLSGPPADPAVSHAHALLIAQPDGTWAVVDLESANGTFIGDDPDPIEANVPKPLHDGDAIHVGSWTTLTLRANA